MRKGLSTAYSGLGWLIVLLGVLQFFLAGLGIVGAESFSAHETAGGILHGLTVLVFLLAIAVLGLAAHIGRRYIGGAAGGGSGEPAAAA